MLLEHTERHPVRLWNVWARCFNGLVSAKRGSIDAGLQTLRDGLEEAGEAKFLPRFLLLLGELASCLGDAGETALALATVDQALSRCERRDEGWYIAELLRIKGQLFLVRPNRALRLRPRSCSCRRSTGRANRVRSPGSCGLRRA